MGTSNLLFLIWEVPMGVMVLVGLGALGFFLLLAILFFIGAYNSLVQVRNNVDKSWKNIDVLLLQRHEEYPKLVEACEAYMEHERDLLSELTEMRTRYSQAKDLFERVEIENHIGDLVGKLGRVWEDYPDLKASQNFIQIQGRVSALESQIADRREMFNDTVNIYNIQIEQFPTLIAAKMLGYNRRPLLEVPEHQRKDRPLGFKKSTEG